MPAPVAVTVLTGFLGSGKTTLLNRLLREPALAGTAVVVNEIGEIAIDNLLIEKAGDGPIEIAGGCICCSVRGELVDTLADLAARAADGRIAELRRIVVETTGLADPAPILQSLMGHAFLLDAFRLDGVVATVDAVNGWATLDRHEEAVRQAAMADRLVLTKTDIAEPAAVAMLKERLARLNPGAPLLVATADAPPAAALIGCGLYDPSRKIPDVEAWLRPGAVDARHHHDGETHHRHHDGRVRTFSLVHDRPIPFPALETFIDLLRSVEGEKLLRMKGIVELAEDPSRPLAIHGVQKVFHPPAFLPAWPDAARGVRLVLITIDMPEDYVRRLFAAVTATPAADTPDRAALQHNPLAVPGMRL